MAADDRCHLLCLSLPRAEELRRARPSGDGVEKAGEAARALGDPTRLMIAAVLGQGGEMCVCDVAWVTERAPNLASHHLRVLRSAGLVRSRRDGKMVLYSLTESGAALLEGLLAPVAGAEVRRERSLLRSPRARSS